MTTLDSNPTTTTDVPPDLFALAAQTHGPGRRRVLSYVGRWGRARRWLPPGARRILDVGCASGYGSAAIVAHGPPGRVILGVERDAEHLEKGRQRFPWVTIVDADARDLPIADGAVDAITMLDVIEHIADADRVLAEAHRVLAPDGVLIISVPHRGLFQWLDALNLYAALRRRWPSLPPLDAATESDGGAHRHYTVDGLKAELAPLFTVDRVARTGLGLQEVVTIGMITIGVGLRAPRVAAPLNLLYLLAYIVDDVLSTGPLAYHLTVRARAVGGLASA